MRTIRVEEPDSQHTWLWLAAGAALGLVAGVALSDRIRRRKGSVRSLLDRGRDLATTAIDTLGPLLERFRHDEEDEEEDDDLDEAEERVETEASDEDELDEEEEEEEEEEDEEAGIDARVLEAFANDPVLAERDVEIEEVRPGSIVLHGRVRSPREIKHAVTIARGVPGVERVRPRLTVRQRSR